MSRVIIDFNLPEEKPQVNLALNGEFYHNLLFKLNVDLKSWIKNGHHFKDADEVIRHIRNEIKNVNFENAEDL